MNDPRSANLYATINFTEGDVKIKSNRIRLNFAQGYSTFVKEIEYAARQCPTDDGFSVEKVVIAFGEEYFVLTPEFDKNVMLGKLLHTNKDKLKITIEATGSTVKPKGHPQKSNSRASMLSTEYAKGSSVKSKKMNATNKDQDDNDSIVEISEKHIGVSPVVPEPAPEAPAPAAVAETPAPAPAPAAQAVKIVKTEVERINAKETKVEKASKKKPKRDIIESINMTWFDKGEEGGPTNYGTLEIVSPESTCKEAAEPTLTVESVADASLSSVVKALDYGKANRELPSEAPQTPAPAPASAAPTTPTAAAAVTEPASTPARALEDADVTTTKSRVPVPTTSVIALDSLRSPDASRSKMRSSTAKSPGTLSRSRSATANAPIYPENLGRTAGEVAQTLQNQLRHTTGSAALAQATAAAFNPNATISSLPAMPRSAVKSTPAKKAKSGNTASQQQELSPLSLAMSMPSASKGKKNVEGRPSIGTMGDQWEFMRSNFFNNNDEEIVWAMVSRKGGAYAHAHKKNQAAEDRYFQCLYDISTLEAKVESLSGGPAARTVSMVMQLKDLCADFQAVPSAETIAKVDAVLEKMKALVASTTTEGASVLKVFCPITEAAIESILNTEDHGTLLRAARKLSGAFANEQTYLRNQLKKANLDSEGALENMEKWARRERDANDYAATMRREEEAWLEAQLMPNTDALTTMRSYIPVNISELSVADIMAKAKAEGGLMSLELATEIKQNKLLHWIVAHMDDIVLDSFLIGDKKTFFENFDQLDVIELRALATVMPAKFENDKDGRKAEWRARFFAKVKQLVSQQDRDLVKGCYDPSIGKRQMVAQPPLKPEQKRRAVYFYTTKEKSAQRVKQYNDRIALLARREGVLAQAEAAAASAKEEYDIVLREMRDPDFIAEYGAEVLARSKDAAKDNLTRTTSALKSAQSDLANLKKTIADMPLSREQYLEQEAEIAAFILKTRRIDWTLPKLEAVEIEGVFDPTVEIKKVEKTASKFVSAEEEAALRKLEMEQLLSRKAQTAAAAQQQAADDESSVTSAGARESPFTTGAAAAAGEDGSDASAAVPSTPMAPSTAGAHAPNTEFRRLSVAQTGMFSPAAVRRPDLTGAVGDANGADFATPRKRNSVLLNANPEMLSTLNRMLMASPAATPSKMSRHSLFPMASSSKLNAQQNNDGDAPNGENKKPAKKVQTRSAFVKQMLNPGGAVSPKRNPMAELFGGGSSSVGATGGGPPKLNFLAQLTARVKSSSNSAGEGAEDRNSAEGPSSAQQAPKSIATQAKSLFADIARFRKSEDSEVAVVAVANNASASAEDKENSAHTNTPATVTSAFAMKGPLGGGGMGGMPRMAMSMFDEIRKRRVIE